MNIGIMSNNIATSDLNVNAAFENCGEILLKSEGINNYRFYLLNNLVLLRYVLLCLCLNDIKIGQYFTTIKISPIYAVLSSVF